MTSPLRCAYKRGKVPLVNNNSTKTAPAAAIDQIGHSLHCLLHAFAKAPEEANIFLAKFDMKDGFWQMICKAGKEWNFVYVMSQPNSDPVWLVAPTSLQMR